MCACIACIEWICLTASGTISSRTQTVTATIAHAQGSPIVPWNHSRTFRKRFSSGVSGEPRISGIT